MRTEGRRSQTKAKVLFEKFVKFCGSRWYIFLYNITIPVYKKREWNGIELKLVGEMIPFIGGEKDVLALDVVF